MKQVLLLLLALCCLCSCQAPAASTAPAYTNEAEECVLRFLEHLKAFDTDACEDLLLLSRDEVFFLAMDDQTTELYTEVSYDTDSLPLYLQYAANKMSFRITSSQVEQDKATVKAYVKTVDGSTLLSGAYGGYKSACEAASLGGKPLPELKDHVDESVLSAVFESEPAMTEDIAEFSLIKTENGWKIHSDSALCPLFTASLFTKPDTLKNVMKDVGIEL